jgi:translation initiation factor 1
MNRRGGRVVYRTGPDGADSAEAGLCPACRRAPCNCRRVVELPPGRHDLRVRRERAGRRGKTVTLISPLFVGRERAAALLRELKRVCGGGGALKRAVAADGRPCYTIEVQGEHAERVLAHLRQLGFPGKRAGG